ncbi:tail fiber assembly protein [Siccibacter turicensis]|uniref:tail fiber assembly protein n=1 Tax=Siccibacter turicensis TaxID=357233 RepID=UPI00101F1032|nr:tail fiber assembly protein [Siccibacter turicensis]
MEKYIYSAISDNFYIFSEKARYLANDAWPSDGVSVSEAVFSEFTQAIPEGKQRGSNNKGYPEWIDIPPPTHEELVEMDELKRQRLKGNAHSIISENQWPSRLALGRINDQEKKQFSAWIDYIDALDVVDISAAPDTKWPEVPK